MPQLAQAQFTLTDDTDIVISIEPPENATKDMLWLSVGQNPITLYRWSGITGELDYEDMNDLSMGYKAIHSKTNYFVDYREQDFYTHLIITNPQQAFGIYNLSSNHVDFYGLNENNEEYLLFDNNDQNHSTESIVFSINQISLSYEQSQTLTYLNSYAAFANIDPQIVKIDFTLASGQLWCPVKDELLSQDISLLKMALQNYDSTRLLSPFSDTILQGIAEKHLRIFNTFQLKQGDSGMYITTSNNI